MPEGVEVDRLLVNQVELEVPPLEEMDLLLLMLLVEMELQIVVVVVVPVHGVVLV